MRRAEGSARDQEVDGLEEIGFPLRIVSINIVELGGEVNLPLFIWIDNPKLLWFYLPLSQFFLAFAYPAIAAFISNRVSDEKQGEVMGIYQSLIALGMTCTPFFCGSLVGRYRGLTVIVSGVLMTLSGMTVLLQRKETVTETR